MRRTVLAFAALLGLALSALAAGRPETVVVLPFVNLSGVAGANALVTPAVAAGLVARGYRVVEGELVEEFLEAGRIRYLDSLSAPTVEKLLARFDASAMLLGVLFRAEGGDNPSVALLLRLIRADLSSPWERFGALSADETQGMFGLGRLPSLDAIVDRLARRMEASLPEPGAAASPAAARAKPLGRAAPRTYRSAALPPGKVQRVVVLPFANGSTEPGAARLAATLAAFRLRASGHFEVVEPADLRAAILAMGVRTATNPDPAELKKLAEKLGTSLFLTGTVFVLRDSSPGVESQVELDLSLVDVGRGRVVWSSHHARRGKEYQGLLELGAIPNAATLTDQVLAEMVIALDRAKPKGREVS
jgi:TolB-like protein